MQATNRGLFFVSPLSEDKKAKRDGGQNSNREIVDLQLANQGKDKVIEIINIFYFSAL